MIVGHYHIKVLEFADDLDVLGRYREVSPIIASIVRARDVKGEDDISRVVLE